MQSVENVTVRAVAERNFKRSETRLVHESGHGFAFEKRVHHRLATGWRQENREMQRVLVVQRASAKDANIVTA